MARTFEVLFWGVLALLFLYIAQAGLMLKTVLRLRTLPLPQYAQAQGLPYDERTSLEVYEGLKAKGRDVSLHFSPAFLPPTDGIAPSGATSRRIFPLGGVSRREIVHCNEGGQWMTYPSDEHGFNNPKGLYQAPLDVLLVGDSFTEGACVRAGEDLASQLRKARRRTLSVGMGGAGPLIELAALKEYGEPLKPKEVAWLYYASDPSDLTAELQSDTLLEYAQDGFSQKLLSRQREIDAAWASFRAGAAQGALRPQAGSVEQVALRRKAGRFLSFYYLRAAWEGSYPLSRADLEQLSLYLDLVKTAQRRTEAWGGRFTFVYLPERGLFIEPTRADRFRPALLAGLRDRGVRVVDLAGTFQSGGDPLSFFWLGHGTHYNAKGYAAAASALAAAW